MPPSVLMSNAHRCLAALWRAPGHRQPLAALISGFNICCVLIDLAGAIVATGERGPILCSQIAVDAGVLKERHERVELVGFAVAHVSHEPLHSIVTGVGV